MYPATRMSTTAFRHALLRARPSPCAARAASAPVPSSSLRALHQTAPAQASSSSGESDPDPDPGPLDDGRPAKGRTGGGDPLPTSSRNAVPQPKISNLSVPGVDKAGGLTDEQRREVDRHNRDFEDKHDRGQAAADDKVDKRFWTGDSTKKGGRTV